MSALLAAYPVLTELPTSLLAEIERHGTRMDLAAGAGLFHDGDRAAVFPLVLSGRVRVARSGADGSEVLLYRVAPGEVCALTVTTLLGDDAYPATGTTEAPVVLHALPRALFLRLVLESLPFRTFVFHGLSNRLARLMTVVEDVALRGMSHRLAADLLERAAPIEATHQMLADDLGTRREIVSRILKTFQHAGYIRLGRRRIDVLNRPALQAFRANESSARATVRKVTDSERHPH